MKIIKGITTFVVTFICITVVPRNIWYYKKCLEIKKVCKNCCDEKFTFKNKLIVIPDSTEFYNSVDFQEKYAINVLSRSVWKIDSLNGKNIFSKVTNSQKIFIGTEQYFKATSSNTYFIKGIELVRADFKVLWVVAYANPIYSEKEFIDFIEKYEKAMENMIKK